MSKYLEWIDKKYPDAKTAKNRCQIAVREMLESFPELEIRVGFCNETFHCWLVNESTNTIIDPTHRQFNPPLNYHVVANRFLDKDEVEPATGAIFLKTAWDPARV